MNFKSFEKTRITNSLKIKGGDGLLTLIQNMWSATPSGGNSTWTDSDGDGTWSGTGSNGGYGEANLAGYKWINHN